MRKFTLPVIIALICCSIHTTIACHSARYDHEIIAPRLHQHSNTRQNEQANTILLNTQLFLRAIDNNDKNLIESLLASGIDPYEIDAINYATTHGHIKIAEYIIDTEAKINGYDFAIPQQPTTPWTEKIYTWFTTISDLWSDYMQSSATGINVPTPPRPDDNSEKLATAINTQINTSSIPKNTYYA